jgi:hypothetical protein
MFVARGLKQLELFYHPDLNCWSCSSHHTHLPISGCWSEPLSLLYAALSLETFTQVLIFLSGWLLLLLLLLLSRIRVCSIVKFWRHSWHVPGAFTFHDTLGERDSAGYKTLPKPSPTPISQVNVLLCWICLITNCSFQVTHLSKTLYPSASARHHTLKILLLTWNPQTKFST